MMINNRWRVVHYETDGGRFPIIEFLDELRQNERAKVLARIDLLEEKGPDLRRPYTDFLRDGIYELRVRVSRIRYRVLYFFCDKSDIVLTHGFKKQVKKVPEIEIKRAKRCKADWTRRKSEDS
jgi:phage-related protein